MNSKLKRQLGLDRPKRTLAILGLLVALHIAFPRYVVATGSMEPTVPVGSYVVAYRGAYLFTEPRAGEIVVFDPVPGISDRPWVHRVQAASGEKFQALAREGRKDTDGRHTGSDFEVVPDGYVYQSGDSQASYHGLVGRELVDGKVLWHFKLPWMRFK